MSESSADKLNVFPARHGVSDHCSPETIITGRTLDYDKNCQCEFGAERVKAMMMKKTT